MSPRAYRGEHRQKQAEQTRERIVEALVEQVLESGRNDFSIADVATRAGVAERTVYRHFPTREDLVHALETHFASLPQPSPPTSPDDVPDAVGRLYDWFEQHAELVQAGHVAGLGRELHLRARSKRGEQARAQMDTWLAPLPARERRIAFAVFRATLGSAVWRAMRDEMGLSAEEARDAGVWLARVLRDDLVARADSAEGTSRRKRGGKR